MNEIKVLNLYAGIGGNRKLWTKENTGKNLKITAVEFNPNIAKIYKDFFPDDTVIIADAHQFILEHFDEYDFIWASPPCPSHSKIRKNTAVASGQNKPVYPDMKLYEEILFLQGYFKGVWIVENVIGWYEPLIKPYLYKQHYYWASFIINGSKFSNRCHNAGNEALSKLKGFDLSNYNEIDKTKILRNCVEPEAGLALFKMAFENKQKSLFD